MSKEIDFKDVAACDILRPVYFGASISIEEIAKKCEMSEKEIKQIIKKGVHPKFYDKLKIINAYKDIYISLVVNKETLISLK